MGQQEYSNRDLPQNITINLGSDHKRSFFDRHFAALLSAIGVISAAVVAGIYTKNTNENNEPLPDFDLITDPITVGETVKFYVPESSDSSYVLKIADVNSDKEAMAAFRDPNGIFYVWVPPESGEYFAELTLTTNDNQQFEKSLQFEVFEAIVTATVTDPFEGPESEPGLDPDPAPDPDLNQDTEPEPVPTPNLQPKQETQLKTTSQTFDRKIGNNGSCTERNVSRNYELCLAPEFEVSDWTGRYQSNRNGSARVERHPSKSYCVVLNLRYSDSGRGLLGDCKGNGWVDYSVTVNGRKKPA